MAEADWTLYRTFLAVIDAGRQPLRRRAALGLTQPTVGRQVEALEQSLGGENLFTRSPGGLAPTRAARLLEPHARAMATAAALARAAAGDAQAMSGVVRGGGGGIMGRGAPGDALVGVVDARGSQSRSADAGPVRPPRRGARRLCAR